MSTSAASIPGSGDESSRISAPSSPGYIAIESDAMSNLLSSIKLARADVSTLSLRQGDSVRLCDPDRIHMHLIIYGEAYVDFPQTGQGALIRQGDYLFAPPGVEHVVRAAEVDSVMSDPGQADAPEAGGVAIPLPIEGDCPQAHMMCFALEMDEARHNALERLAPELRARRRDRGPRIHSAEPLVSTAALDGVGEGAGAVAALKSLAELLLIQALREHLAAAVAPETGLSAPDSPQISAALRLIYEHPERMWSLANLAKAVGMSRSIFAEAFTKRLQETPIRYISRVRMRRAQNILRDSDHPLAQIAHFAGYRSEAAFARAFKRAYGMTPSEYRRQF